jgi:hypothetical protein
MIEQDYSYSLDSNSKLINIQDAVRRQKYYCPCCKSIMIPKQGPQRRWHFAHKGNDNKCSYETYLHKIAKRRICESFNALPSFKIEYYPLIDCAKEECTIGRKVACNWASSDAEVYDLKEYGYTTAEEEREINGFRADILLINQRNDISPILVEIYVTHRTTAEKIQSGCRIIEIKVESESDIDDIVSSACIKESVYETISKQNCDKIRFYNFKHRKELPNKRQQKRKYMCWIGEKNILNNAKRQTALCLSDKFENSVFRIESENPIDSDLAFALLAESKLGFRYCPMCRFYSGIDSSICMGYIKPTLIAMKCKNYTQIDYDSNESIKRLKELNNYKVYVNYSKSLELSVDYK